MADFTFTFSVTSEADGVFVTDAAMEPPNTTATVRFIAASSSVLLTPTHAVLNVACSILKVDVPTVSS